MKVLLVLAAIVLVALIAIPLDYGFYNPPQGTAAPGRGDKADDARERELLKIVVADAELKRFNGKVTLHALSELYGTKDSIRCSVMRTYNSDNMSAAHFPIERGSTATLCLN